MTQGHYQHDRWDTVLFVLSLGGLFLAVTAFAGLLLAAALALLQRDTGTASGSLWLAVAVLATGAVGFPGAYLGLRSLLGHPPPKPLSLTSRVTWIILLLTFAAALGVGYLAFRDGFLPDILGPLAHVLAGASPILLVVWLALRWGRALPLRRILGQFMAGLWIVPILALVLEGILLLPILILLVLGMTLAPEGRALIELLSSGRAVSPAIVEGYAIDIVTRPWFLIPVFVYLCGIAPAVEEVIKTLPVWPFLRRRIKVGDAFQAGVIGGGGYALFEALFQTQAGDGWAGIMIARGGVSLMHAFTAALTCWSIGAASVEGKRWPRVVAAYLGSVAIHAVWNAGALGIGLARFLREGRGMALPEWLPASLVDHAPVALGVIAAVSLLGVVVLSLRLRRAEEPPAPD